MNRVGDNIRFKDGKGRKFFPQKIMQEVNGELFAFKMADIRYDQLVIGIKKLMVFEI